MSIATAITAAQGKVAAAYTAVSNKGGTLPATQNLANLPTAINSITSGGTPDYVAPKNNVGGMYQADNSATTFSLNGATDVYHYALAYAFYGCTNLRTINISSLTEVSYEYGFINAFSGCTGLTSVDLSALEEVSAISGCFCMFYGCTGITNIDLSALKAVSGSSGCCEMFRNCTRIVSVNLSSLESISGVSGCSRMFSGCTGITSANLSSLKTLAGSACSNMFAGCTALTELSFPAITTTSFGTRLNQFSGMCQNIPNITLHFPSNVQSVIEGLTGYSATAPFGATAGTVLFDLPATE